MLIIGIAINLGLLGYFKYANFFVDNINVLSGSDIVLEQIILPLAISFFTFQQIAYLIDAYCGETREYNFLHYCLFVTFFPQLIAGPIVHHREMLPQFAKDSLYKLKAEHLAVGVSIFFMGLFKKVVLADGIAVHATPVFTAAENGAALTFFDAWGGALAYTFQLYFDFSGYSDMALGLARMFGVTLPVNFFSPYKANNIIDFWRRWHVTLSRFLRDYLYIPLGGNRKGATRRHVNLMTTMLLGGLWHGAGWTFVIWGGLHGSYLVVNHGWHAIKKKLLGEKARQTTFLGRAAGRLLTFIAVVIAWVVFRAESMNGAMHVYEGMLGVNGFSLPYIFESKVAMFSSLFPDVHIVAEGLGAFGSEYGLVNLFVLLLLSWFAPNTLEWMQQHKPALGLERLMVITPLIPRVAWRPSILYGCIMVMFFYVTIANMSSVSEFLYFQF